jgi:hypothetical protein
MADNSRRTRSFLSLREFKVGGRAATLRSTQNGYYIEYYLLILISGLRLLIMYFPSQSVNCNRECVYILLAGESISIFLSRAPDTAEGLDRRGPVIINSSSKRIKSSSNRRMCLST